MSVFCLSMANNMANNMTCQHGQQHQATLWIPRLLIDTKKELGFPGVGWVAGAGGYPGASPGPASTVK